jgi:hypothetical protein
MAEVECFSSNKRKELSTLNSRKIFQGKNPSGMKR